MKEFVENLLNRLEEEHEKCINRYGIVGGNTPASIVKICIEIVKDLASEHNNGWIPCEVRLPEEYGEYLCCDRWGEYIVGYPTARVSSDDFYVETEHEIMNDCIAWQPLPAPYKKGE